MDQAGTLPETLRAARPVAWAWVHRQAVLGALDRSLAEAEAQLEPPVPAALSGWFELNRAVVCETLAKLGSQCGTE